MSSPEPPPSAAWGCLIVPLVLIFLAWVLWPSTEDRQHWREITADMRTDSQ